MAVDLRAARIVYANREQTELDHMKTQTDRQTGSDVLLYSVRNCNKIERHQLFYCYFIGRVDSEEACLIPQRLLCVSQQQVDNKRAL